MKDIIINKTISVFIIILLSCLLYSIADNKIPPGGYAGLQDLKQSFYHYIFTPTFKEKYAFLNIDDDTYDALNNPDYTPPELITRLVLLAEKSDPKVLFIDVDLRPSIKDNEELASYLEKHDSFPILLTDIPSKATNLVAQREGHVLDKIVNNNPNLFWVSTLFYPQSDGIIRQSSYFNLFCSNNKIIIRPSISFAVRVLDDFNTDNPNDYGTNELNELLASVKTTEGVLCSSITDNGQIKYTNPNTDTAVLLDIKNQSFNIQLAITKDSHIVDESNNLIVFENSAKGLATEIDINDIPTKPFDERIFIIGGTNYESKDIHETPIGSQHGAYLILNAIESALNIKNPYRSHVPLNYLALLCFAIPIAIASVLFRNTVLVIISLLLLVIVPRIFDNSYTIELFSVLIIMLIVEVLIEVWDFGKRLKLDFEHYKLYFIFSSELRENFHTPRSKAKKHDKDEAKNYRALKYIAIFTMFCIICYKCFY